MNMNNIMVKKCSEDGCKGDYHARGYCRYHYYSLYWNVNNRERIREAQKKHYWSNVDKFREKGRLDQARRKGTLNYKYSEYKKSAKDNDREFTLTKDDFKKLWLKPCYYCNSTIENIGLDRLDNSQGYIIENVVSCCIRCNKMKRDMNHDDFIALCKLISSRVIPFAR